MCKETILIKCDFREDLIEAEDVTLSEHDIFRAQSIIRMNVKEAIEKDYPLLIEITAPLKIKEKLDDFTRRTIRWHLPVRW